MSRPQLENILDIARVHMRFYEPGAFIRGQTMIDWVTKFGSFGQYKRMWMPDARTLLWRWDDDRLNIVRSCHFVTFTPVGVGMTGITGDLDEAISDKGLSKVLSTSIVALTRYAWEMSPPMHEHITEAAFLAAFTKTGPMEFCLQGVVHTDARLIPAITQIG